MSEKVQLALGAIVVLGALAQWIAWRLRVPSILLLLLIGFVSGPVLGWISPIELFGDMLQPLVSIAVALILFEGGLSLNFREIRGSVAVIALLVTAGAVATWILAAGAGHLLLGLDFELSILLGAILTVTGPTVVLPLLRHVRPSGPVGPILKWEGIIIDPIGALLAVLVFEVILSGSDHAASHLAGALFKTVIGGGGIGLLAAVILAMGLKTYGIPDHLQTAIALMLVVAAFIASNLLQPESGLLAVTVMGIALANQRYADVSRILEFKENLRVFLLSAVFILLSARMELTELRSAGPSAVLFVVALILIVRPACVAISTIGSSLNLRQRAFLAAVAPRGIVAAAVTSVFALELERTGHEQARMLVPVVFITIVITVLFYGLSATAIARKLGLSDSDPQGLLLIGANRFARQIAEALQALGIRVVLVDTNRGEIAVAQMAGLTVYHGNVLSEETREQLELTGIGRLLALTSNDEVNLLATERFARIFGSAGVFQLPPKTTNGKSAPVLEHSPGRQLFRNDMDFWNIDARCDAGARVRATKLTQAFDYAAFQALHGYSFVPLFIVQDGPTLQVLTVGDKLAPKPGQVLVTLAPPRPEGSCPEPAPTG